MAAAGEVAGLLAAAPPATSRPTRRSTSPNGPWPPLDALRPHLDTVADELAVKLRDDHIRVREAGGQRVRRQIAVRAQKPADVLGVYVYLPGGARMSEFPSLKIVGGLLSSDLLARVFAARPQVPGTRRKPTAWRRASPSAAGVPVLAVPAGDLAGREESATADRIRILLRELGFRSTCQTHIAFRCARLGHRPGPPDAGPRGAALRSRSCRSC